MKVDAVVLAGGSAEALGEGAPYKGAIELAGREMVSYVVEALKAAPSVSHVAVVVPTATELAAWADDVDKIVIKDEGPVANLLAGVDSFGYERHILALAGDIPLLTADALEGFLSSCGDRSAGLYFPIISRETAESAYPDVKRTYWHLVEGTYTGGNLMLFDPRVAVANRAVITHAFDARKSPLQMIRILGLPFVLRFLTRRLRLSDLQGKVGEILRTTVVAVEVDAAEIGMDVDKPSDSEFVVGMLTR